MITILSTCPTCGARCTIGGDETRHYAPIGIDPEELKLRIQRHIDTCNDEMKKCTIPSYQNRRMMLSDMMAGLQLALKTIDDSKKKPEQGRIKCQN